MKTIDFSKVKVKWIDGSTKEISVARELATVIFQNAINPGEHLFSLGLYTQPVVELTDENRRILEKYVSSNFGILYYIQEGILKEMNS